MWMLTKFAMIFFILALALIITNFSQREQNGLCTFRAQELAKKISSSVEQVISSPVADERRVLSLDRALATSSGYERYSITLLDHVSDATAGKKSLIVLVNSSGSNCNGGDYVPYNYNDGSSYGSNTGFITHIQGKQHTLSGDVLTLHPSSLDTTSDFLVIIKCETKQWPYKKHLIISDCQAAPTGEDKCISLNSADPSNPSEIDKCCGWGWQVVGAPEPICNGIG